MKNDTNECVAHLEKYGGRLFATPTRCHWPDGTDSAFAWIYQSTQWSVTAKTAMDAIREHMKRECDESRSD